MAVTIHDLARLSGFHASTISRALRHDPRVRAATRDQIAALARQHGYTPNLPARQLAAGKTGNLWFIFGSPQAGIELQTALIFNELAFNADYDLQLVLHANSAERFRRQIDKLYQRVADGALIIPPGDTDACRELTPLINALPCPHIFIDRYWDGLYCPIVTTGNRAAVRHMAECCLAWGAQSFHLNFNGPNPVSRARLAAAQAFLEEMGVPYRLRQPGEAIRSDVPVAVLGDVGGRLDDIQAPAAYGGCFDQTSSDSLRIFRRQIVCRQNLPALAGQAADIMWKMLNGSAPMAAPMAAAMTAPTEIPPLEFQTLEGIGN